MDKGMINRNIHIILIISGSLLVIALIEEIVTIFQTVIFVNLRNQIVLYLYTKVFRKLLYCKMSYSYGTILIDSGVDKSLKERRRLKWKRKRDLTMQGIEMSKLRR